MSLTHGKGRHIFTTRSHFENPLRAICSYFEAHFCAILAHAYIGKALGYLPNTRMLILSFVTYSTSFRCKKTIKVQLSSNGPRGKTLPICSHLLSLAFENPSLDL